MYLAVTIVNLAGRVNALETQLKKGTMTSASRPNHGTSASASQPREDTLAASSATGTWNSNRKSGPEYRPPTFQPWPLDSGWCRHCQHYWASDDSEDHFTVCRDVWETVMKQMFVDWNSDAEWCHMKEGYAHTETHVTQALVSCEGISVEEEASVATSFRRM